MRTIDYPVGGLRCAEAGRPIEQPRAGEFDADGGNPPIQALFRHGEGSREPERSWNRYPEEVSLDVLATIQRLGTSCTQDKSGTKALHQHVADHESQGTPFERRRNRHADHKPPNISANSSS